MTPKPPPTKSVTIGPYSFQLHQGYTSGAFAIGPVELAALDDLRNERLRKKGFKVLEKLRGRSGRRTLSEAELRHLTTEIAQFDRDLRLEKNPNPTIARSGGVVRAVLALDDGAFDDEVTRLAAARIDAEERSRGITLSPSQREAALAALRDEPLLREQARARIDAMMTERDKLVEDLF